MCAWGSFPESRPYFPCKGHQVKGHMFLKKLEHDGGLSWNLRGHMEGFGGSRIKIMGLHELSQNTP